MTALIIGIIAALGIGGGLVVANNGGGHGGGGSAIVEPVNPADNLNPNYELISALTDENYTITAATEGSLLHNYYDEGGTAPGMRGEKHRNNPVSSLLDGYDPRDIYDLSGGDLIENGQLEGDNFTDYNGQDKSIKLDLRAGVDKIGVTTWKAHEGGGLEEQSFYLTSADVGTHHTSGNYKSFEHQDEDVLLPNDNILHHYTAIHLGGSTLGLSTADFGRWEESSWETDSLNNVYNEDIHYQTFMFFDNTYAYQGVYNGPNALNSIPLQGWAIADVASGYNDGPRDNNLYTGNISFNLNLANNTLTGAVSMPSLPSTYSFDFTGDIVGSIIRIDGTAWQEAWPEEGVSRGGMGKLLVGKDGLEIVGNMGPQVNNPTEEYIQNQMNNWGIEPGNLTSEQLRSLFEHGKVDYTFGAKEVIN